MDDMTLFAQILTSESRAVSDVEPVVCAEPPGETERQMKSALLEVDRVACVVRFRRWRMERRGFIERVDDSYRFVYYDDCGDECRIRIFSPGYNPCALGALLFRCDNYSVY